MDTCVKGGAEALELTMVRRFAAPPELVFAAWTEAEHFKEWFAPSGCSVSECEVDARPGGRWRSCMRWSDGTDHWQGGVFQVVEPYRRLVFTYAWDDEHGHPKHETLVSVVFEEVEGQTELRFHQATFESGISCTSDGEGWSETLLRLADFLSRRSR